MAKAYSIFKYILLGLLAVYVVLVIVSESRSEGPDAGEKTFLAEVTRPYRALKNFMQADPYNSRILDKQETFENEVKNYFSDRVQAMYQMTESPDFSEQMFSFAVFNSVNDMKPLIARYFGEKSDFRDLIIIDKDKNIIYKYGSESFFIKYYNIHEPVELLDFGSMYAMVHSITDESINFVCEIIAFYDYSGVSSMLDFCPFPAFVRLGDKVITGERFPQGLYDEHKESLESGHKVVMGLKVIKPFEVVIDGIDFGTAGSVYPVRSLLSYLLILLKIVMICVLCVGLYFTDRLIHNLIGRQALNKEEMTFENPAAVQKSVPTPEQTEEDNLVWIKNYIRESEEKK